MKESNCSKGIGKWRPGVGLALASLLAFSVNVYGGDPENLVVSLVPVEAHVKPGDIKSAEVGTIVGDEIFLDEGGANVWLEVRIGDWTDTGVGLNAWSVDIDKSGFSSGLFGTLTAKRVVCDPANPDAGDSDCIQALGPGATWAAPQPPRLCMMPIGAIPPEYCAPAFADATRPDWVSPGGIWAVNADRLRFGSTQPAGMAYPPSTCQKNICDGGSEDGLVCDHKDPADQCVPGGGVCPEHVCRDNFACWAVVAPPNDCNQGFPSGGLYAGTVVVEVPGQAEGALGTFEIDLMNLVFVDTSMVRIPYIGTRSAKITVGGYPPVLSTDPPNCAIDARQMFEPSGPPDEGWDSIEFAFTGDISVIEAGDFGVREDPLLPEWPQTITGIDKVGSTVTVHLGKLITLQKWTCVTYIPRDYEVCMGHLPADVNSDITSNAHDINYLIDCLTGDQLCDDWQSDIDRSGRPAPPDLLREIDMLNGAHAYDPWFVGMLEDTECPTAP